MAHTVIETAARTFGAPLEAVFGAIRAQEAPAGDRNGVGRALSIKSIWGTPGAVGHQYLMRANWGVVDLEIVETILAIEPPTLLRLGQRPMRFLHYDADERLPPMDSERPRDPDALFRARYGEFPAMTEIEFSLHPSGEGTAVDMKISSSTQKPLGWLARRIYRKTVGQESRAIFDRIEAALARAG